MSVVSPIAHTYWRRRYGHAPMVLTRAQFVALLVREEGLPQWAAESLTHLAESRCTILVEFETDRRSSKSTINQEFYVTASRPDEAMSPQREMLLGNLESRNGKK